MAQCRMFTCDSCGSVVKPEQRTKKRTRLEGPKDGLSGEFTEDLCPECVAVPEGVEMKPLPRRQKKGVEAAA